MSLQQHQPRKAGGAGDSTGRQETQRGGRLCQVTLLSQVGGDGGWEHPSGDGEHGSKAGEGPAWSQLGSQQEIGPFKVRN